MPLSRHKVSRI